MIEQQARNKHDPEKQKELADKRAAEVQRLAESEAIDTLLDKNMFGSKSQKPLKISKSSTQNLAISYKDGEATVESTTRNC